MKIEGDRIVAFLIIDGKTYSSDCDHQDCLEAYYKDKGVKSEFDYSDPSRYDEVHEKEIQKTFEMKNSHEVYGFDLFDTSEGYFLIGHDKETLENNKNFTTSYVKENPDYNIKVGYFTHPTGYDVKLVA